MIFFRNRLNNFDFKKEIDQDELNELRKENKLEKGDFLALIIAATSVLLPVAAIVLLAYYVISMLLFG